LREPGTLLIEKISKIWKIENFIGI
jgi:hypothetical protein